MANSFNIVLLNKISKTLFLVRHVKSLSYKWRACCNVCVTLNLMYSELGNGQVFELLSNMSTTIVQ